MYYLNDATGNCTGVVCGSTGGSCSSQPVGGGLVNWTRMDAWGNLIAEIFNASKENSLPAADLDCSASQPSACASTQPATLDKPQVLAGPYQYHGSQGYEADVAMPTREQDAPPFKGDAAKPISRSTQFMHVGCRYYEPATGRFLEFDPIPADPTPFSWGQQNRWVYCANDPVNFVDPSGNNTEDDVLKVVGGVLGILLAVWIVAPFLGVLAVGGLAAITGEMMSAALFAWAFALFGSGSLLEGLGNLFGMSELNECGRMSKRLGAVALLARFLFGPGDMRDLQKGLTGMGG